MQQNRPTQGVALGWLVCAPLVLRHMAIVTQPDKQAKFPVRRRTTPQKPKNCCPPPSLPLYDQPCPSTPVQFTTGDLLQSDNHMLAKIMKPQLLHHLMRHIAFVTLLGGSLFFGGVARIHAQESISPLERCSRVLKFGEVQGSGAPTKVEAVHALGLLGDPRAIPLLVEHLENEANDHLRLQIVRALGWIGSDAVIPALVKSLKDQYPYVRQQSAAALKKITGKEFEFDKTGLLDPAKLREMLEKAREERKKG